MELACDPLNRELFKQENGRAEETTEKDFGDDIDGLYAFWTGVLVLPIIDEGLVRYPDGECPGGESSVPDRVSREHIESLGKLTYEGLASSRYNASCSQLRRRR